MKYNPISINERPDLLEPAAKWFSSIWRIPYDAYIESMNASLKTTSGVPKWYVVLDENDNFIAGIGVIENDFHKRPDLTPNVCAVYVKKEYRMQGLAKMLLNKVCNDLAECGIKTAYLLTDHTDFYEHCGWRFYQIVEENGGDTARMYIHEI